MSGEEVTIDLSGVLERLDIIIGSLESDASRQSEQLTELKSIESDIQSFNEKYELIETRVDVLYQASMWIILLLGLISGILFVIVFSGGKKK